MALKEPFHIVATLNSPPGKAQELIAAILPFAEHVQATEPGCLQYELFQPTGSGLDTADAPIVLIELWKDMAALEEHRKGEQYHALLARTKDEGLLSGPPEVKILQAVGGFPART
ncbi:hypothetical protein G647_05047 [Cladophialophora carrionii CBS 160.54]|uniref:ABM domain-containing protein n=1 Tax=Cladophialophora carrionii CBS 160.54 TaxID=1279043 RepID=V9DAB2_9EURO|nr:uncharacterized protein G647_05047 [Cladophialophora carrionii CBS 160.54]ETI23248.1 hypothetical protein G647_05047 [Cladophialophora carrionii CBS 160.54]